MCHQQGLNPALHGSHSLASKTRTGIVNSVQMQLSMEATHLLESQEQASSAGSTHSSPQKHSQTGEPRASIVSRAQMQLTMEATHSLVSRGQVS